MDSPLDGVKMVTDRQCPVCESNELATLWECQDHLTNHGSFTICECKTCEFRFTNPYPSQEDIHIYYESEDYVPVSNSSAGMINKCYHVARQVMLRVKRRFVMRLTKRQSGRLLDIGCGTGEFADQMVRGGWTVCGVEPFDAARDSAKDRFNFDVVDISEQSSLPDMGFDVITLWHVLEHAHDLNHSFRELQRLLAQGGTVLIGVPNYTCFDARFYGSQWAAYDVPRHLFHFCPDTMKEIARRHGFEVVAIHPLLFDPLYIPLLTEKERGDRSWIRGLYVAAVSFLTSVLQPERCSALTYVLRRSTVNGESA